MANADAVKAQKCARKAAIDRGSFDRNAESTFFEHFLQKPEIITALVRQKE